MGTKQQTTSQASQQSQFAPSGMQAYNTMIPQFQQAVSGYMNNPFGNPFFQTQRQMGTNQAQQQGGTQMSSLINNMRGMGFGGGGNTPFLNEMIANQGRANAGLTSQLGFLNPMLNAQNMQQFAMGQAGGFQPLQTGQTQTGNQTQTTSGLGTWLPQLLGGGLSALTGMMGGGGLLKGGGGGATGPGSPWLGMAGTGGSGALPMTGFSPGTMASGLGRQFGGGYTQFNSMPNPYLMGGGQ